jgi:hypothetical protein
MNKEYLIAKANLCQELAVEQLTNGQVEEGVENIKRVIRALREVGIIAELEAMEARTMARRLRDE